MSAGFASSGSGGQGFAIKLEKDGDTKLGNSDGDLHQVTGTLQLNDNVFFLANGRVGLGVSDPSYKFSVGGSMEVGQYIYHRGDSDTFIQFTTDDINFQAGGVNFIDITQGSNNEITFNEAGADIDFRVEGDSSTHLLFVEGGTDRVGIHTNDPDEKLHVSGNLKVEGDDARIKIDGDTDSHPGLEFYENGTRKWIIFNNYGDDSLDFKTNSTTRMVINQAGTVGIGTQSPDEKLHVAGNLKIDGDAPTVTVKRDDNADASTLQFQGSGGVVGSYIKFLGNESGAGGTNNDLALGTGATVAERMRIRGDGKVGIGTTSPDYTLDVAGNIGVDEYIYHNGDDNTFIKFTDDVVVLKAMGRSILKGDPANNVIHINNGGHNLDLHVKNAVTGTLLYTDAGNSRVGIGTDSPSTTLEVSGNTKIAGTTTSQFYVTQVKEQDLGSGTSSTLTVASGTILLDADSINGSDMGGGMEVHMLAFPRGNDSGTRLSLIVKTNTNSVFILPSGLISGTFDTLSDSAGVTATEYVWISEGTHQAWHQVK